jgi:hypothetical protein
VRRGQIVVGVLTALLVGHFAMAALAACKNEGTVKVDDEVISGSGTVNYVAIEGGFYVIHGDDGNTYDPLNLAKGYQVDGLRVCFVARLRKDVASFHMVAPLVEIQSVTRLAEKHDESTVPRSP